MFKLTLVKKIIFGFAGILILLLVVGLIAYDALTKGSEGFTQYREMARDANLAGRVQANMLMARFYVKNYIITLCTGQKTEFLFLSCTQQKITEISFSATVPEWRSLEERQL